MSDGEKIAAVKQRGEKLVSDGSRYLLGEQGTKNLIYQKKIESESFFDFLSRVE